MVVVLCYSLRCGVTLLLTARLLAPHVRCEMDQQTPRASLQELEQHPRCIIQREGHTPHALSLHVSTTQGCWRSFSAGAARQQWQVREGVQDLPTQPHSPRHTHNPIHPIQRACAGASARRQPTVRRLVVGGGRGYLLQQAWPHAPHLPPQRQQLTGKQQSAAHGHAAAAAALKLHTHTCSRFWQANEATHSFCVTPHQPNEGKGEHIAGCSTTPPARSTSRALCDTLCSTAFKRHHHRHQRACQCNQCAQPEWFTGITCVQSV
jgi:hypothetical protein